MKSPFPSKQATNTPDAGPELPKLPAWQPIRGPFERWPQLTDLLIALFAFFLTLLMWSRAGPHQILALESLWDVAAFQCAFIGCFALLWRRTHPWQVHAVVLAATVLLEMGLPAEGIVAMAFSLYCLGRYEANTRASWIALVATLAFVVFDEKVLVKPTAGGTVAVILAWALWYIGRRLRFRSEYLRLMEERAGYLERERNAESERAVAAERTRIAREMHDVVAHQVSLMTVQAGAARTISRSNPEAASEAMAAVEAAGRHALSEMRHLLGVLRPASDNNSDSEKATLTPQPDLNDLPALIEKVRRVVNKVDYETRGALGDVPARVALAVYRIVQESLTNVIKHVGAQTSVNVSVRVEPGFIAVCVRDDGLGAGEQSIGEKPIGEQPSGGHGIAGMRERVELLGGQLHTGVIEGGGFEVTAQLPTVNKGR
ncbi:sensor histidine kinase [Microbulbifer hydrolyticus]|uniref:histidine kinase n=1 Tax=Microbulbifer hydrolyticus TaxID=48074 RepID=A0A6P1T8A4_9GAMM|nr:sensor histidine kinase [Microbulbifer hydrolyticus]MBB5210507.1 signal transduction histidine kinase [Microbulbifer hydrolyticus]QHQ39018.1 sensor histidine kinase [Microbulbifer hydrolyticus]